MKQDTLEGRAKTKNGVKRLCFSAVCILLEAAFIIVMITKLNQYAEIVNLMTRLLAVLLVLKLYASDQTSSMKMPYIQQDIRGRLHLIHLELYLLQQGSSECRQQ